MTDRAVGLNSRPTTQSSSKPQCLDSGFHELWFGFASRIPTLMCFIFARSQLDQEPQNFPVGKLGIPRWRPGAESELQTEGKRPGQRWQEWNAYETQGQSEEWSWRRKRWWKKWKPEGQRQREERQRKRRYTAAQDGREKHRSLCSPDMHAMAQHGQHSSIDSNF